MIELGCHWALFSLMFKNRYNHGTSILVDLVKENLQHGINNYELNNLDCPWYHAGVEISSSHTLQSDFFQENQQQAGDEINFLEIWKNHEIKNLDVLHMDIQGSELAFLQTYETLLSEHKISNIVIATHDHLSSTPLHQLVKNILLKHKYYILEDIPCKTDDGYIWAHSPKNLKN